MLITINGHELTLKAAFSRYPGISRTAIRLAASQRAEWSVEDLNRLTAECDAEAKRLQVAQSAKYRTRGYRGLML